MKKLGLLFIGGLLFCSNASADLICVKQKVAPNKFNKVMLSKNIKTVTEAKCPKGFIKLIDTKNFKGPQGEKGDKGDKGEKGSQGLKGQDGVDGANFYDTQFLPPEQALTGIVGGKGTVYVSLQIPSGVQLEIASPWECEGSVEMPTAPAGKVCIYPIYGQPTAERVVTSSKIVLNTKALCEANNKEWKEPYCIANKADGVTPIDSSEECQSGPYNNGNSWNGVTGICTRSKSDKASCESPLYAWDDTKACFVNGVLGLQDEPQCATDGGSWLEKGCSDTNDGVLANSAFNDEESCLAPSRGTWVPSHCEVSDVGEDGAYSDHSNAGFKVTAPAGEFAARWAYAAPELM